MNEEAKHPVKAARTTLRVVEALEDLGGAGVTEVAERVDLPKSSVHNYLSTLREEGYVVKDGSEYRVGLRFLGLGASARLRHPVYEIAKSEVAKLARQTGELANLAVEENGQAVYIYRETGEQAVKVDAHTGHRIPLHNTALGKAILAHLPRSRVETILDHHGMPRTTPNTITDRGDLFEELESIRDRGVAFDREERLQGLRCVAAPILNADRLEGAISVAGPISRLKGERFREELPEQVLDAANVVELNVTYS